MPSSRISISRRLLLSNFHSASPRGNAAPFGAVKAAKRSMSLTTIGPALASLLKNGTDTHVASSVITTNAFKNLFFDLLFPNFILFLPVLILPLEFFGVSSVIQCSPLVNKDIIFCHKKHK